jgi:hypothetical protein
MIALCCSVRLKAKAESPSGGGWAFELQIEKINSNAFDRYSRAHIRRSSGNNTCAFGEST